mmetsp:Transcript_39120/g.85984  ORF Transcript_39120/g.85984 Transcript_39120/m.85984 type:complete len:230 (+) Transcript_39120:1076-1765(+)
MVPRLPRRDLRPRDRDGRHHGPDGQRRRCHRRAVDDVPRSAAHARVRSALGRLRARILWQRARVGLVLRRAPTIWSTVLLVRPRRRCGYIGRGDVVSAHGAPGATRRVPHVGLPRADRALRTGRVRHNLGGRVRQTCKDGLDLVRREERGDLRRAQAQSDQDEHAARRLSFPRDHARRRRTGASAQGTRCVRGAAARQRRDRDCHHVLDLGRTWRSAPPRAPTLNLSEF